MSQARAPYLAAFAGGFSGMALEIAASRLLGNYFGSSQPVWAVLIGLILFYITIGNLVGGRWADRSPRQATLAAILGAAAILTALVPYAARPLLGWGQSGLGAFAALPLVGSLVGVIVLLAVPVTLLGCVTPFCSRLVAPDGVAMGRQLGAVYAVSTMGALAGTWLTALVLIPGWGTRPTFMGLAVLLAATAALVSAAPAESRLAWGGVTVGLAILLAIGPAGVGKDVPGKVYEVESAHNYIQVVERGESRLLLLNEGEGIHSVYRPGRVLTRSVWDLFLVAPYFGGADYCPEEMRSVCLIGLAAGTSAKQFTAIYGPIPIDGVELDPEVIAVGQQWFDMTEPNLNAVADDGRHFLAHTANQYDLIIVDAYRPPYIPPQLATVEFFREARGHLTERGVVAINVGRSLQDDNLVLALASTMSQVFPRVYVVDLPIAAAGLSNSMVVGTMQEPSFDAILANLDGLTQPELAEVAAVVRRSVRADVAKGMVLTDDHAPVEWLVHRLMLDYALNPGGQG